MSEFVAEQDAGSLLFDLLDLTPYAVALSKTQ